MSVRKDTLIRETMKQVRRRKSPLARLADFVFGVLHVLLGIGLGLIGLVLFLILVLTHEHGHSIR